jgi:hypothetical protein
LATGQSQWLRTFVTAEVPCARAQLIAIASVKPSTRTKSEQLVKVLPPLRKTWLPRVGLVGALCHQTIQPNDLRSIERDTISSPRSTGRPIGKLRFAATESGRTGFALIL